MKCIIIDDEPKARNVLRVLVKENCPKITEIFEAEDLLSGVAIIKEKEPSIVFLDIEMPGHSGLEILEFIERDLVNFEIIFTTAYSEYAIEAFQLSAVDYLLKPVRPNQIRAAVDKALNILVKSQIHQKLDILREGILNQKFNKIAVPVSDGVQFVPLDSIVYMAADGMYTTLHTLKDKMVVSKPLKHFVGLLQNKDSFYRPHRSFLINLKHIKQYVKSDGGYLVMDNGHEVSISKDKKEEFLNFVSRL